MPGAGTVGTGLSAERGTLALALAGAVGFGVAAAVLLAVMAMRLTLSARSLTAALAALASIAASGFEGSCAEDAVELLAVVVAEGLAAGDGRGRAGTIPPRVLGPVGAVAGF